MAGLDLGSSRHHSSSSSSLLGRKGASPSPICHLQSSRGSMCEEQTSVAGSGGGGGHCLSRACHCPQRSHSEGRRAADQPPCLAPQCDSAEPSPEASARCHGWTALGSHPPSRGVTKDLPEQGTLPQPSSCRQHPPARCRAEDSSGSRLPSTGSSRGNFLPAGTSRSRAPRL